MSVTNEELPCRKQRKNGLADTIGHTAKSLAGKMVSRIRAIKKPVKDLNVSRETKNDINEDMRRTGGGGFWMLSAPDKALYLAVCFAARAGVFIKRAAEKAGTSIKREKNPMENLPQGEQKGSLNQLYAARYAIAAGVCAMALYFAVTVLPAKATLVLYAGGEKLGAVESVEAVEVAKLAVERKVSWELGYNYKLACDVTYDVAGVLNPRYISNGALRQAFEELTSKDLTKAVGLHIDGNLVAVCRDRATLENSLKEALEVYECHVSEKESGGIICEYSFANFIEFTENKYPKATVMTERQLRRLLNLPEKAGGDGGIISRLYLSTIMENKILEQYRYHFSEPQTILPTLRLDAPEAAQTSGAADAVSARSETEENRLNYSVSKYETVNETVPYETLYEDSYEMRSGETAIIQRGIDGLTECTYRVSYVDHQMVAKKLVDQNVIRTACPMIILIGKRVPTLQELETMPTGTYILPYDGPLTSGYGWRTLFGYREFHAAWDIGGPAGSSVVAIDGGEVIFSGNSKNGYGNYVMVDHGDDLVSLYAHFESNTVKVGDRVAQGDEVGKMGCTGQATGVHVHLEIRKNNVAQNPGKYLPLPK